MKKQFLLIPIFLLCSSCTSPSLYFTENPVSFEEAEAFAFQITNSSNLIPSGWYKYKEYNSKKELIFNCTFKFTYNDQSGRQTISNLNGVYKGNNRISRIFSDENFTIIEQEKSGSSIKRFGGENVTFSFGWELFLEEFIQYSTEFYLRNDSICCIKTDKKEPVQHQYKFAALYNKELNILKKAEVEYFQYVDINLNLFIYTHIYLESCEETYTKFDKEYDISIDNKRLYEFDL